MSNRIQIKEKSVKSCGNRTRHLIKMWILKCDELFPSSHVINIIFVLNFPQKEGCKKCHFYKTRFTMGGPTGRRIFNGLLRFFTNNVFVGVFQYHITPPKRPLELMNYEKSIFLLLLGDHLVTTWWLLGDHFFSIFQLKTCLRTYGIRPNI